MARLSILLLALALALPAGARAEHLVGRAAQALRDDPVYVDPGATRILSEQAAERLRQRIARTGAGPMYIAVLPQAARAEAGGDTSAVLQQLFRALRRPGTYAVVAGSQFRAGSTRVLPPDTARELADEAFAAHGEEGVEATLADFVGRVGEVRQGRDRDASEEGAERSSGTPQLLLLVLLAVAGLGFFALRGRARAGRRALPQADFAEVRAAAREDLLALADDIRALDLDIEMPDASQEAKHDYGRALECYERADRSLDRARRPEDLEAVSAAIEEGRFAMASAKARLEGRAPPDRRPPCFFDPRHGPSTREVEWAPPEGQPRPVPACEADALRVEEGGEPEAREVMVGGERVPYWNAPGSFGPWAGGYYGGLSAGLLPALLIGSMLGGTLGFPGAAHGGSGDWGGDGGDGDLGDFGGGDFGGGDFGGGDFGGGDFGGGD